MKQSITVPPGETIRLADFATDYFDPKYDKKSAKHQIEKNSEILADLGERLYAENRRSLLLVLQGMDTSGKDGTIRTVMDGVNPQSCQVVPFKQPSAEELDHDFLWRIHQRVPARGNIGIFNRSHYEDVLVVRVHNLVPPDVWQKRYDLINSFEKLLTEGGTTIVKCFLHISKDEQRERLQARLDDRAKRWKFSKGDLKERLLWDQYQEVYEAALNRCNTEHAPWHIIPSGRKWYRNLCVSQLICQTLQNMDPELPPEEEGLDEITVV